MPCTDELKPGSNYIIETVKNIDRIQKDSCINRCSGCITCENVFIQNSFNTIPFSLYCCNGLFTVGIDSSQSGTTGLFRVECIRDDRYATLRLLTVTGTTTNCLDQTVTVDLQSFNAIQCFTAITCSACSDSANQE